MQNRIASLRGDRAWTQRDLARRARVPQARVSAAESGVDVRTSTALKLARAFSVPVEELFGHLVPRAPRRRVRASQEGAAAEAAE